MSGAQSITVEKEGMTMYENNCKGLKTLKLSGFLQDYIERHSAPEYLNLSHDEAIASHICAQLNCQEQRQYTRLLKASKLRYPHACPEDIDYLPERGLKKPVMEAHFSLGWVAKHQNIFLLGKSGSGKTFIACALGQQCIRHGNSVLHYRLTEMLEEAMLRRADGSLPRYRAKIQKAKVLLIDDWAISPLTQQGRQDLLEIIESKSDSGSIIITSQMPVESWHDWLGEPTIADAILDRLVHCAHVVKLQGDSMRKLKESVEEVPHV